LKKKDKNVYSHKRCERKIFKYLDVPNGNNKHFFLFKKKTKQ